MYDAALLYDSNFDEDYLHFQNSEVDLYILGNFTQYRDFKMDLDSLYFNRAVQADVLDEVFRKFNGLFCAFYLIKMVTIGIYLQITLDFIPSIIIQTLKYS